VGDSTAPRAPNELLSESLSNVRWCEMLLIFCDDSDI